MTDLSLRIRNALTLDHWIPMRDLEKSVGVRERGLQSENGEPGPLRIAIREIYSETGLIVVTKSGPSGGVMLTRNLAEVEEVMVRLRSHTFHQLELADLWQECIRDSQQKAMAALEAEVQPELFSSQEVR